MSAKAEWQMEFRAKLCMKRRSASKVPTEPKTPGYVTALVSTPFAGLCCFEAIISTFSHPIGQMVDFNYCHHSYSTTHIINLILSLIRAVKGPSFFTFTHRIKNILLSEARYAEIHPLKGSTAGLTYEPVAN